MQWCCQSDLSVSGGDPAYRQRVIANAVFASMAISGGEQQANRTGPLAEASEHLVEPFAPRDRLDLSPQAGRLATEPFEAPVLSALPDVNLDFDRRAYTRPVAGAYAESAGRTLP